MATNKQERKKTNRLIKNLLIITFVLILLVGAPLLFLKYQGYKTGMSISEVFENKTSKSSNTDTTEITPALPVVKGEKINFLNPKPIGQPFKDPPVITNVCVNDLDNDGLLDVIVCDAKSNTVSWIRQFPAGVYTEKDLVSGLVAPAHVQVVDFDKDGDKDLAIAVLGLLFPSNDKIGSVIILENDGKYNFTKHVIVEQIARVSDVRAGDLDGDGDLDLAVAQFGYDDGETRWIENLGNWQFESHILQNLSGPINVEIVDIDHDGDNDVISLVSQEWEEIYCFVNDGKGHLQQKLLWNSKNEDFGSSGIYIADFNKDGLEDILYTNGDAFDYMPPVGKIWHGIQWLENKGKLNFEYHRVCTFVGAYSARPVDIDSDGDLDLFAVSAFNLWNKPESQSFIWLENDKNQFIEHDIANAPTHIITLEPGDFNNDGNVDFVTGGMHAYPPFDRMGRIILWTNIGFPSKAKK